MAIIKLDPFAPLRFRGFWPSVFEEDEWIDTSDEGLTVYETDNDLVIKANVAGIPADKVEVSVEGGVITIKGEYQETEEEKKKKKVIYKQSRSAKYLYTANIPCPVVSDKAQAVVENGIITVTLPKAPEAKPKKIAVKAKTK